MNAKRTNANPELERFLKDCAPATSSADSNFATDPFESDIANTLEYLVSRDAAASMEADSYWPKWHSPWWHMTLLYEMGLAKRIPAGAIELLIGGMERYLHFFPFTEQEVPEGRDPLNDVLCHCALATAHRVLAASGLDIDQRLPWVRPWFTKYQLSDGGYNCDESSYIKDGGKSSMVSTVNMLESWLVILQTSREPLSDEELQSLDRTAQYILNRRLIRSISKEDRIMDPTWLELTFPRFYEIDVLRILRVVLQWSLLRQKEIEWNAISEVVELVHQRMSDDSQVHIQRAFYLNNRTRVPAKPEWLSKQPVTVFPLLEKIGAQGKPSAFLTKEWWQAIEEISFVNSRGLLN